MDNIQGVRTTADQEAEGRLKRVVVARHAKKLTGRGKKCTGCDHDYCTEC